MIRPQRNRRHDPERDSAEYVSGELSVRARRWFERHLLDCDDCWREVLLGRFGRRIAEDAREPAPVGLRDRVRAAVVLSSGGGLPSEPSG
ncbi:MAG TPA: zf-HC2 domain-containing protein [Actinomycetota bacterium]|jgi:anti-sigma factor RsiW